VTTVSGQSAVQHVDPRLTASQQLEIASAIIQEFRGWVTNVDTRIATLSAGQAALALYVVTLYRPFTAPRPPFGWLAPGALALFVGTFAVATVEIVMAIRPRLATGPALNHFMFPSVAVRTAAELGEDDPGIMLDQAWRQVHALSVIAVSRYRHFSKALRWTILSVLAAAIWIAVSGQLR
jgi:hypothetical protein